MRTSAPGIDLELHLARNLHGALGEAVRYRLRRYMDGPSAATWDDVAGIILDRNSWTTVWQAWLATDPNAAIVGRCTDCRGTILREWSHWPTPQQFATALRFATH